MEEDILKSILETDEGEAAGIPEAAAKLLRAYSNELPEDALKILVKAEELKGRKT